MKRNYRCWTVWYWCCLFTQLRTIWVEFFIQNLILQFASLFYRGRNRNNHFIKLNLGLTGWAMAIRILFWRYGPEVVRLTLGNLTPVIAYQTSNNGPWGEEGEEPAVTGRGAAEPPTSASINLYRQTDTEQTDLLYMTQKEWLYTDTILNMTANIETSRRNVHKDGKAN